ncbi:hypothetical protein EVAR_60902_1 [Eumeta japonica]|uniref:Uncharacterized protein n=1 Tax=Eumeta variegata TaxID=151549 RepID=A0A4C1ZGI6_EUMVA|nr:hypothetical protein EVAR_60902_1 [Eumeta japonica]
MTKHDGEFARAPAAAGLGAPPFYGHASACTSVGSFSLQTVHVPIAHTKREMTAYNGPGAAVSDDARFASNQRVIGCALNKDTLLLDHRPAHTAGRREHAAPSASEAVTASATTVVSRRRRARRSDTAARRQIKSRGDARLSASGRSEC